MIKVYFLPRARLWLCLLGGLAVLIPLAHAWVRPAAHKEGEPTPGPHPLEGKLPAEPTLLHLSIAEANVFALTFFATTDSGASSAGLMDNAMFCPGGVIRLLCAVQAGAKGKVADEIAQALLPGGTNVALAEQPPTGKPLSGSVESSPVLRVGSALWSDPSLPFNAAYAHTITTGLGAQVASIPIRHDREAASREINSWAAKGTGGNIQELVKASELKNVRLVLTDVAWFKDSWQVAFQPERTTKDNFTLADGKLRRIAYLCDERDVHLSSTDMGQALALPFADPRFECIFLLPSIKPGEKPGDALVRMERGLSTPSGLPEFDRGLAAESVKATIFLPSLDLRALDANMVPTLRAMKINTVFSDSADLSTMVEHGNKLKIGLFRQVTSFRLDEKGAEATSASVATVESKGLGRPKTVFRADRPCLLLVRNKETGELIFMIRCAAPSEVNGPSASEKR